MHGTTMKNMMICLVGFYKRNHQWNRNVIKLRQ